MSRRTKLTLLAVFIVGGIGGVIALSAAKRGNKATDVRLEAVAQRDLTATVTASGRIEAKRSVDVTADITGRITMIAVKEGDLVRQGQRRISTMHHFRHRLFYAAIITTSYSSHDRRAECRIGDIVGQRAR